MSRLGFPRANRVLRRPEFQSCFDQGRRYFTKHFVVFALPRDSREPWRLGLTVTRRTGSAPMRNRVKRVLREFFRLHQRECDPPHDYVVVPKRNLDPRQVGLEMVSEELLPVLGRISREARKRLDGASVAQAGGQAPSTREAPIRDDAPAGEKPRDEQARSDQDRTAPAQAPSAQDDRTPDRPPLRPNGSLDRP
ncbi:ribonuclease P protein component [Desulfovibrio sp. X2]|uniref:ribonuclease P protein component n=1 Tax=Desulfovibrio sp. X2 TaxID=941449 RepID=UPI000A015C89|nr:ribonuclease P protein component [Desulfovibrio sp. X2]